MKKILITITLLSSVHFLQAQTFSEWFRQKKTQIKYLIQQIAADEVFLNELKKGYSIAQNGLSFIGDMKKGEFDLHTTYFNSLKAVSPTIAKYSRINDIISYQHAIMENFKKILQAKNISQSEINYMNVVYNNMSSDCNKSLDELIDVVTDDIYTMKDDQRIKRIDAIYCDMKDKYAFTQSFTSEALLLSAERQNATHDINESLINKGIK
jgi:hypothetical protein